jgi:hypothetical protein
MAPKRAELKVQARHIRDTLGPLRLANHNLPHLDNWTRESLRTFLLSLLDPTPPLVTYADIQFSHVENAISELQLWSHEPELKTLATRVLNEWDKRFAAEGGVSVGVKRFVWGKGNILEGCKRTRNSNGKWVWKASVSRHWKTLGDMGLLVGQWWVHPVCVYRDGFISAVKEWVSCDDKRAYAVVLGRDLQQNDDGGETVIKWFAKGFPKEVKALCNNLRQQEPVRVFRRANLVHKDAPCCGIRYDGLYVCLQGLDGILTWDRYTVGTWGMGPRRADGSQEWKVVLEREIDSQSGMAGARKHPICEERDIHKVFCAMRIQLKEDEKKSKTKSGLDWADEGHISARSSALQDIGKAVIQVFRKIA